MLAGLMVGAVSPAAAGLSVVIGAISQGFGGVYQDRFPLYRLRQKTASRDPIYTIACARRWPTSHLHIGAQHTDRTPVSPLHMRSKGKRPCFRPPSPAPSGSRPRSTVQAWQ